MGGDMAGAARDLARTVADAVAHVPVAVTVKNLSTLSAGETAEIRRVFESELKPAGQPAAEVQLTISENLTQFLLVAEIDRHGERQVLLESWPRTPAPSTAAAPDKTPRVTLEKKLLWAGSTHPGCRANRRCAAGAGRHPRAAGPRRRPAIRADSGHPPMAS